MLSVIPLILSLGCSGNNPVDNSSNEPTLFGTVVDGDNVPVKNADIHYYFASSEINTLAKSSIDPNPTTQISFSLPTPSHVTIRLLQSGTRKFIRNLVDTAYGSGNYSVRIELNWLTNGIYIYQMNINGTVTEHIMVHQMYDMSQLLRTEPLTRSGDDGTFSLSLAVLGIGEKIYRTAESSPTIIDSSAIDSIAIVVYRDSRYIIEGIKIINNQSIHRTFILK